MHQNMDDCSGRVIGNIHMLLVGFEPAIVASERTKTHALDGGCVQ